MTVIYPHWKFSSFICTVVCVMFQSTTSYTSTIYCIVWSCYRMKRNYLKKKKIEIFPWHFILHQSELSTISSTLHWQWWLCNIRHQPHMANVFWTKRTICRALFSFDESEIKGNIKRKYTVRRKPAKRSKSNTDERHHTHFKLNIKLHFKFI